MYFVWISEQTAIISLCRINWLFFITDSDCLLRGTDRIFNYNPVQYMKCQSPVPQPSTNCILPTWWCLIDDPSVGMHSCDDRFLQRRASCQHVSSTFSAFSRRDATDIARTAVSMPSRQTAVTTKHSHTQRHAPSPNTITLPHNFQHKPRENMCSTFQLPTTTFAVCLFRCSQPALSLEFT
jgi:hypothetical protein